MDDANRTWLENAHPEGWENPKPSGRYNLVVVGAGTAGLVSAAGAAGLGAKVAIVEERLMGGDCLNVGCVPSKSLIRAARAASDAREAESFGVKIHGRVEADFGAAMERLRRVRAGISRHDSAERFRNLGVDVFLGRASFSGKNSVEVEGRTLLFRKAVIATGARAARPDIPGIEESGFLTNENAFDLTERPRRLACLGAGPIGCELAQAFRRLGSDVHLFHNGPHILNREDPDAARVLQEKLVREGVNLVMNARILRVSQEGGGKVLHYKAEGREGEVIADEILVGTGRVPNVEGMGLESAGVAFDPKAGVKVDDFLQTSNPDIYAAGDVCMGWKFTHAADAAARIAIQNALFIKSRRLSKLVMPWCTYTDPEIAHVGLYEREARERGIPTETFLKPLAEVDRALTDGEPEGFVKVLVRRGSDQILGATIVSRHAGESISELTLAISQGVGLGKLSGVIHPYPTQADAIRLTGDLYNRTRLTPGVKRLFSAWLRWRRRG